MNSFTPALIGAITRILLWIVSGAFLALGVPEDIQTQINDFIGTDPMNAAMVVLGLVITWYVQAKVSKGNT